MPVAHLLLVILATAVTLWSHVSANACHDGLFRAAIPGRAPGVCDHVWAACQQETGLSDACREAVIQCERQFSGCTCGKVPQFPNGCFDGSDDCQNLIDVCKHQPYGACMSLLKTCGQEMNGPGCGCP